MFHIRRSRNRCQTAEVEKNEVEFRYPNPSIFANRKIEGQCPRIIWAANAFARADELSALRNRRATDSRYGSKAVILEVRILRQEYPLEAAGLLRRRSRPSR